MQTTYRADQLKPYSLELYGEGGAEDLIWKIESDDPFTPMSRGDRVIPMDAPGARPDVAYEITAIEHLIWSAGDKVRYVTRIHTREVAALG